MPPLFLSTRANSIFRLGITVLTGCGCVLQSAPSAGEIVIARRAGRPDTTIVLGTGATEVERFAARELQSNVAMLTRGKDGTPGVELPIHFGDGSESGKSGSEILIGSAATHPRLKRLAESQSIDLSQAALGGDGFVIKTVPTPAGFTLLLTGSHERSSLFAVYRLLQLCGVEFFGYQDRGGEVVPRLEKVAIAAPDVVAMPRMKYRFVSDNNFSATDKTKLVQVADWAAKNGCNAFAITPSRAGETWEQIAIEEVRKRGLMVVGPGHILARLTPDAGLFGTHPEYFPLIKGQRQAKVSASWGGVPSFCWSNAEAMNLVVEHAADYAARNPCIDIFSLYPPDGSMRGSQCQCAACAKQSLSDWYLTLINRVAARLPAIRPGVKLMWISYNECGVPPRDAMPVEHGRNMILLWCNDLRNHHEPMNSDANRHAAAYLRSKPALKGIKTDGMKNPGDTELAAFHRWRGWSDYLHKAKFSGDVVLLDYYNAHVADSLRIPWLGYSQSGPWPDSVMQQDFQWYASEGIAGWQNCTDYYNDSPNPWWNWLAARLMWDSSADVPELHERFCRAYYGEAGPAMEKFLNLLWRELASEEISDRSVEAFKNIESVLKDAERMAAKINDSAVGSRITVARKFYDACLARKWQLLNKRAP